MPRQSTILHGQEVSYLEVAGEDPTLMLLHGVGSNSGTWDEVVDLLAANGAHVVTLDLPGHGASGPGRGDYSLGAFASLVRDLMDHLGIERAVLVGHSLGGGVSMQFAYQFPERCVGLVLVASGGLGREASIALRAATLPGSEVVLATITRERTLAALAKVGHGMARAHLLGPASGVDEVLLALRKLQEPQVRKAFLASLRSVVDVSGQRVRAQLVGFDGLPVLVVWGDRDSILPLQHGREAAESIPSARMVVFPGASHEPHRFDPQRFADVLLEHAALVGRTHGAGAVRE